MTDPEFAKLEVPDRREQLLRWLTPSRKAAILGGLTLLPALGLGTLLTSFFDSRNAASKAPPAPRQPVAKPEPPAAAPAPATELDRLRAEVALADQKQLIERASVPRPMALPPRRLQPAATPPPVRPERAVRLPPLPPQPAIDLVQLAYLGSSREQGRAAPVELGPEQPAARPGSPVQSTLPHTSLDPSLEASAGVLAAQPVARPPQRIPAATLAVGVLEQPILWEENTRTADGGRYPLTLTEPVLDGEGQVLLDAGIRLLASVERVSANGLVQIQAVALRGERRELSLAAPVRAVGGLPLVASKADRGGEIAGLDLGQSLLKGAEDGLAILNRAAGSIQTSAAGGSTTVTTFGAAQPLAALGSGIFGELGRVIRQRNQQAVREALTRPQVWFLPAGTPVEVLFVREVVL